MAAILKQLAEATGFNLATSVIVIISIIALIPIFIHYYYSVPLPAGVPLIRESLGKKTFSFATRLQYITNCEQIYQEAYTNYTSKGRAVIVPGIGTRYELLLPSSSIRWVLAQPESVLGVNDAFVEIDQVYYSLGHTKYVGDAYQAHLVRDELNSMLDSIAIAMNEELHIAISDHFGMNTDAWTAIDLQEKVRLIIAQVASRFTVGLPLCRNKPYLDDALASVDAFVMTAGLTFGSPAFLRPLVGRLVGLKSKILQRRITNHFRPTYEARLETLKNPKHDPDRSEPMDHLQLILRYAKRERPEEVHDIESISRRLTAANLGSMHLTTIHVINMLLNIVGSDAEHNTMTVLRNEVKQVLGEETIWSKAHISKMIHADSIARETMRCHSFGGRAIFRKVLVDNLITDTGVQVPKGTILSILGRPAQSDPEKYKSPSKFNPFRFSGQAADSAPTSKRTSFVTTSPDFLPFGYGKHACPGRFLVDFELKMFSAYIVNNYDLKLPDEYKGKRPENKWLMEVSFPPSGAQVLVKRRQTSV